MELDTLDTNLLQSAKRPKNDTPAVDEESTPQAIRKRQILKWVAYAAFFLWSLVFFTFLKIPDAAVANYLLNTLNQNTPYQWQAESMRLGIFPWLHLEGRKLNLEPKFPGAGMPLTIEQARIYPNPFSLLPLGGSPAFGGFYSAEAYQSSFRGSFAAGRDTYLRLESGAVDLARITPLQQSTELKGTLTNLLFRLSLPQSRASQADGEVKIQGKNIIFDPSSLGLPMPLPILNVGDVDIQGTVAKGVVKFEKFKMGGAGKDIELQIRGGSLTLADVTLNTRYDLRLLVKLSAGVQAAVPGITSLLDGMATKQPDGAYAMRLQGSFSAPGFPSKD